MVSRYLIFITQSNQGVQLTVTNGLDKLYQVDLDQDYLERHRLRTGIEGTWKSYFTLLKQALDNKFLSLTSLTTKAKVIQILLKVHYPLIVGAKITGTFDLSEYEIRGRERHEVLQTLLFKVTELLVKERQKPAPIQMQPAQLRQQEIRDLDHQIERLNIEGAHLNNPKKRKPKGTLVNPYLKKRRVQGAKFAVDDDNE